VSEQRIMEIKSEEQREKRRKKSEQSRGMCGTPPAVEVPGEERAERAERAVEEIRLKTPQ